MLRGAAVLLIALSPNLSLLFLVVTFVSFFSFSSFVFFVSSQPNAPLSLPLFLLQQELQRTEVDDSGPTFRR